MRQENQSRALTSCSAPRDLTPPTFSASTIDILKSLPLTGQQQGLITTVEECAEKLGRMPSAHEIRMKTSDSSISRVSIGRIHKIIHELNSMLPGEARPLTLTPHRPHLLYRHDVHRVAEEYRKENYELPPTAALQRLVREQCGLLVSATTLKFIMRDLYRSGGGSDSPVGEDPSTFRVSRKRLAVSWKNIVDAYTEAVDYLAKIPAQRAPAAEEIGHFLRKAGIGIENDALKFRLRNAPSTLGLKVTPYSDLAPAIIRACHKRIKRRLCREPTIHELTEAFNKLALQKSTVDALSARVLHINKQGGAPAIKLNERRRSGVYDQDILRFFKGLTKQLKRAPTFTELISEARSQKKETRIREDSFLRRVTRLKLALTHPFDLKEPEQELVRNTIAALKAELGRSPLKEEVLRRCAEQGAPLAETELIRILGTIKKRGSVDSRITLHLASPPVLKGALKQAIRSVSPTLEPEKLLKHVSAKLGWSAAAIYRVASLIVGGGDKTAGTDEVQAVEHKHLNLLAQAQQTVWNEHRDIRETTLALAIAFGRAPLAEEVQERLLFQGSSHTLYRVIRTLKSLRAAVYPELQKMLRVGKRPEYEGKLRKLAEDLPISVDPMSIASSARRRFGWSLEGTYEMARSMTGEAQDPSGMRQRNSHTLAILRTFAELIEKEIVRAFETARGNHGESLTLEDVMQSLPGNQPPFTPDQVARYLQRKGTILPRSSPASQVVITTEEPVEQLREILFHPPFPKRGEDIRFRVGKELSWSEKELTEATHDLLGEIAEELADRQAPSAITGSDSKRKLLMAFGPLLALLPPKAWPEAIREPLVMRHIIAHLTHRLVEARMRGESDSESRASLAEFLDYTHELLKPWELDLTKNVAQGTEATVDKLLSDAEVIWICLSALPGDPLKAEREPFEIRKLEAHWCAEMDVLYHHVESLNGLAHAVVMAESGGLLSQHESRQLRSIQPEYRQNGRGYWYLRGKIHELASRLGFPRG